MARLFFALWPDPRARDALADLARSVAAECGGRAVPPAGLHLTLVFLGEVAPDRIGDLRRVAAQVAGSAFVLPLDRVGGFARARVAWAGSSRPPPGLFALQADLERGVRGAGFSPDARPFAPHLTLARRTRTVPAVRPVEPVAWRLPDGGRLAARGGGRGKNVKAPPDGVRPS
jgi:2'-5' RNA ligase